MYGPGNGNAGSPGEGFCPIKGNDMTSAKGPFMDHSSICKAALAAGTLSPGLPGLVAFRLVEPVAVYGQCPVLPRVPGPSPCGLWKELGYDACEAPEGSGGGQSPDFIDDEIEDCKCAEVISPTYRASCGTFRRAFWGHVRDKMLSYDKYSTCSWQIAPAGATQLEMKWVENVWTKTFSSYHDYVRVNKCNDQTCETSELVTRHRGFVKLPELESTDLISDTGAFQIQFGKQRLSTDAFGKTDKSPCHGT